MLPEAFVILNIAFGVSSSNGQYTVISSMDNTQSSAVLESENNRS